MLKRPNHTTQLLKSKPRGYLYNNEMILQGRVMSQIKPLKILIINPAHKMTRTLKAHIYPVCLICFSLNDQDLSVRGH